MNVTITMINGNPSAHLALIMQNRTCRKMVEISVKLVADAILMLNPPTINAETAAKIDIK